MTEPVVEVEEAGMVYGTGEASVRALDGVNLQVLGGEMLALVAEVARLDEPLGRRLRELVEGFDYVTLHSLLHRCGPAAPEARGQPAPSSGADPRGRMPG